MDVFMQKDEWAFLHYEGMKMKSGWIVKENGGFKQAIGRDGKVGE